VALYFRVRIGVRGGATRLGSQLVPRREQTQTHPCLFLLAEGGVGEAALKIERMGLGFLRHCVLYTSFVSYSVQSRVLHCTFIVLVATRGATWRRARGNSIHAHTPAPPHSSLTG
jgi:hypothetical protein